MALILPLCLAILVFCLYRYVVYPTVLSPLTALPSAHYSSSITNAWILLQRYQGTANRAVHQAHLRHGPIVRLSPTEISINCVKDGLETIYVGNFDKHGFYSAFENYGERNMFSMRKKATHASRKRGLTPVYNKSFIQYSPDVRAMLYEIIFARLLPVLEGTASRSAIDLLEMSFAVSMDVAAAFAFGTSNGTDFLRSQKQRRDWIDAYRSLKPFNFWAREVPWLVSLLQTFGIPVMPPCAEAAAAVELSPALHGCQKMQRLKHHLSSEPQTKPILYDRLNEHLLKQDPSTTSAKHQSRVASELMDHLLAGCDSTAVGLTYTLYEVARHPSHQLALRRALISSDIAARLCPAALRATSLDTALLRDLDALPLLDAVILESLRLYPPAAGSQPRVVGAAGTTLAGYAIPAGTRVSAQAYSLHRNEVVFPDAEAWVPERWTEASDEERTEMRKWFWAFGSGARACIAKWLALQEMKIIVAAIVLSFDLSPADDMDPMQKDGYSEGPVAEQLFLRFDKIDSIST